MKNPSDILTEFFAKMEWRYEAGDSPRFFRSYFNGDSGRWPFVALVSEDNDGILVQSLLPATAPVGRRPVCLELLNRVNHELLDGCFEMDPADGEIRFRSLLQVGRKGVSLAAVERLIAVNLKTVDRFFPAIMSVVYAGLSAPEALKIPSDETAPTRRLELN